MTRWHGGAAILAAVALAAPAQGAAQRGPGARDGGRAFGPGGGEPGVEAILRRRERLELTGDQIARLDAVRAEGVRERAARRAEMEELASRVRAGQAKRSEMVERMRAWRDSARTTRAEHRERAEAVLSDAQREELEAVRREARAYRMGRASALRGSGGRAARHHSRGFRRGGPGFGPDGPPWSGGPGWEDSDGAPGFAPWRRSGRGWRAPWRDDGAAARAPDAPAPGLAR